MQVIDVSTLNEQIKSILEIQFLKVAIEGEISRPTYHGSGHIYFTLKDQSSLVKCVLFRGNANRLKFRLEDGLKVIVHGGITLYKPRGEYQINAFSIEPAGIGNLSLAYEQLKKDLQAKGYFDEKNKKTLPKYIHSLALITSSTGAALQDMLRVIENRWPLLEVKIFDVLVQGDMAKDEISRTIQAVDTMLFDTIILSRGGGSIEDLWAFNESIVADAIFKAKTPIVSAIGHEIDWLISDFVSDLRAPTPSAAIEMILPDKNEMLLTLDRIFLDIQKNVKNKIEFKEKEIKHIKLQFEKYSIDSRLNQYQKNIDVIKTQLNKQILTKLEYAMRLIKPIKNEFNYALNQKINTGHSKITQLEYAFNMNNPINKTKKGFAQVVYNGKMLNLGSLEEKQNFNLISNDTKIKAQVLKKESL